MGKLISPKMLGITKKSLPTGRLLRRTTYASLLWSWVDGDGRRDLDWGNS